MKGASTAAITGLALLLAGCGGGTTTTEDTAASSPQTVPSSEAAEATLAVSRSTWTDGEWPFTVDEAVLGCQGDGLVTITANGTKYGLSAASVAQLGLPDATPAIGIPDPNKPGLHLNAQPLIAKGLELCGNSATPNRPAGGSNTAPGLVEKQSWTDGPWPFTVDSATLMCTKGADGERVTVTANREMYALNGTAKSADLWPDFDAIWADDPGTGLKVNIGPMLDRGLALCE